MVRYVLTALAAALACGAAAAQNNDVNCTLAKVYRCNKDACETVPLDVGIRFNAGTKQGCLTRGGNCVSNLAVASVDRTGEYVVVHFSGNGMVMRIHLQAGTMVGADASENNQVFPFGGNCQ